MGTGAESLQARTVPTVISENPDGDGNQPNNLENGGHAYTLSAAPENNNSNLC